MRHPSQSRLALFAGEDLGWWSRLRVGRHVSGCDDCARAVQEFRAMREWTLGQDAVPAGLDWNALASEMRANIRVGLAAGACVGELPSPGRAQGFRWQTAAMALPVLLIVLASWLLQSWPRPLHHPAALSLAGGAKEAVLEATPAGIGYEQDGRSLTLLHPRAEGTVYSTSSPGSVHARYVDAETGYVTISHVYAQ